MAESKMFTLVNVVALVVIAVLIMLLLLPAINVSRDRAHAASQCKNNLKNIGIAMKSHEAVHGFYPSGGWGNRWVGHPDLGTGVSQPGGWAYAILPFMEQQELHDLGGGYQTPENLDPPEQRRGSADRLETALPIFYCPTRRRARPYPAPNGSTWYLSSPVTEAARTDYAANGGDTWFAFGDGPVLSGQYRFPPATGDPRVTRPERREFTGIVFVHHELTADSITDGHSNTIMVGEKFLNPSDYETGTGVGDELSAYHGGDTSQVRWGAKGGLRGDPADAAATVDTPWVPRRDRRYVANSRKKPRQLDTGEGGRIFGSAHGGGCNFAFGDGAVRTIAYDVDPLLFAYLCNRRDGEAVDFSRLR